MKELEKIYDPSSVEDKHYKKWVDAGYFHAERDPDKRPYTIVMPPPNITGQLHMGHAMDETWQDILIRYKRMQGYAALWVPGTDHASIATEAKIVAKFFISQPFQNAGHKPHPPNDIRTIRAIHPVFPALCLERCLQLGHGL